MCFLQRPSFRGSHAVNKMYHFDVLHPRVCRVIRESGRNDDEGDHKCVQYFERKQGFAKQANFW